MKKTKTGLMLDRYPEGKKGGYSIPSSVSRISDSAFYGCTNLTSVSIPSSVSRITSSSFYGCTSLTSIDVDPSSEKYCSIDGVLMEKTGTSLTLYTYPGGKKGDYSIPSSVNCIWYYAFSGCAGLTSVNIPSSVINIMNDAFESCTNLTSIDVDTSSETYCSIDGVLMEKTGTSLTLYTYPGGKKGGYSIPSSVSKIKHNAFSYCTGLTTINIPSSVTEIGVNTFESCTSLTSIDVDSSSEKYCSIDGVLMEKTKTGLMLDTYPKGKKGGYSIPSSVTEIHDYAFEGCSSLTSVNIPSSVTEIHDYAFGGCSSLTSVNIPSSVIKIGSWAFCDCSGLTSVTIPSSVTEINGATFYGCTGLTSVNIPSSVIKIGSWAFYGCTGLTSMTIDGKTEFGDLVFHGCTLKPLLLKEEIKYSSDTFIGLNENSVIYACDSQIEEIKKYFPNTYAHDFPCSHFVKPLYFGLKVGLDNNPAYAGSVKTSEFDVVVKDNFGIEVKSFKAKVGSENLVSGLNSGKSYTVEVAYDDGMSDIKTSTRTITTKQYKIKLGYESTQTTATVLANLPEDETTEISDVVVNFDSKEYKYKEGGVTIEGLRPDYIFTCNCDATVNGNKYHDDINVYTKGFNIQVSCMEVGPTSAILNSTYSVDDANIVKTYWKCVNWKSEDNVGETITVTGLAPETTNTYYYCIVTDDGYEYTKEVKVTTPSLVLTTMQPKCVSERCAIVAAETNISEIEPNVGFQWKKHDAPSTLKPNEGYGAIYDGFIEGYIKNLQPVYYDVRAFYKTSNDKYYYGEWVTFDPTDYSFFEPTVHTYPVQGVGNNSATVRGYALAGTDNIESQGFQYWPESNAARMRALAPDANDIRTVEATGQIMTATLSNLEPGTAYVCRAFVKTSAGYTYGEEQSFTTSGVVGIGDITVNTEPATVVGYYNLQGMRFDTPQRGLNIVVYSDGTTRKMIMR